MIEPLPETTLHHWFFRYADDLLGFLRRKVGDSDAPDLVQDIYLRVISYPAAAAIREPRAFLFRAAANLVVDHLRREIHRGHENVDDIAEHLVAPAPNPEDTAIGTERMERFRAALAELPPLCRHAFVLNRFDGLTHTEIAERLGLSPKTVQRHIQKALDHCLSRLEN
ncbi:RNA polymerase sigma factor [Methylocaldum sp. MU1018]